MFVKKLVDAGEPAESIAGVGDEALIVEGTHVLETPHRRLAADTVLLWVDGDKEYRLESDLDRDTMVEIAQFGEPGVMDGAIATLAPWPTTRRSRAARA